MAKLKIPENSKEIDISTFRRPCYWFDQFQTPQTDDIVRFDVPVLGGEILSEFAGHQVKIQLTERGTVLKLRGMFSSVPLQGGEVVFQWDACQWLEAEMEKLYVDKRGATHLAFRLNGKDLSKGRAWALGLPEPEPVFDTA